MKNSKIALILLLSINVMPYFSIAQEMTLLGLHEVKINFALNKITNQTSKPIKIKIPDVQEIFTIQPKVSQIINKELKKITQHPEENIFTRTASPVLIKDNSNNNIGYVEILTLQTKKLLRGYKGSQLTVMYGIFNHQFTANGKKYKQMLMNIAELGDPYEITIKIDVIIKDPLKKSSVFITPELSFATAGAA